MTMAGDPRFFARSGPYSLAEVARAAGGEPSAGEMLLTGVAPLGSAGPTEVSFLDNPRYIEALAATRAGAVIVSPAMLCRVPPGTVGIATENPYAGWARVAALFHPPAPARPGIHPSAVVLEGARVDPGAEIGPFCLIGAGAAIGAGCRLGAGVAIGDSVSIGADCRLGAGVSISHATLGARVHVKPGARIGQEGFGFATTPTGFLAVPQLGLVVVGDDVEVGANTTIDRGSARDTVIGAGSRLDNQVQIGHNVRIGRCCVLVSHVAISGSTTLEDFVQVGGQAGMAGHLKVGRGARIGAQAGVIADIPAGTAVIGSPAQPAGAFFRQVALLKRLAGRRTAG
ncbi:UDP-3-O-(3-hydroxymyristoyl)glucosamine N-acyltransferase [Roseomonas sp. NAR14]|uniref:UDP-3-O-acylglucosamine N-acyltransferase n=1 Tax=Roseomonas acroporae TaxID=2937791 RepID=A0A9X1Y9L7_9PROT|nr:UDP-3-O-(3-hydroxymyristoyl)glucosamine N-acyltransferase [Roseomonas acroporae]MCK8786429.1 UDP-3-O-(3-hydroxymyristoyl)glucosamine N-acyltransferase [Roseomonas acroporae]